MTDEIDTKELEDDSTLTNELLDVPSAPITRKRKSHDKINFDKLEGTNEEDLKDMQEELEDSNDDNKNLSNGLTNETNGGDIDNVQLSRPHLPERKRTKSHDQLDFDSLAGSASRDSVRGEKDLTSDDDTTNNGNTIDLGLCAVTGCSGWLAYNLVGKLTMQGYNVVGFDLNEPSYIDPVTDPNFVINNKLFKFHKCNILNKDKLIQILKNVKTIFHICSITDIRIGAPNILEKVNINGTKIILDVCKINNITNFVYCSSIESVNNGKPKYHSIEDIPYATKWNRYGTSKTKSEILIRKHIKSNKNLKAFIMRVTHLFGPRDPSINATIRYPITIGDGKCKHSLIYIDNAANAHILAAKKLETMNDNELLEYNGSAINIKDFDHNFVSFYRNTLHESDMNTINIPYTIAYYLAWILDFILWLLYKIFGLTAPGDPVEQFGLLAVQAACTEHTWNIDKSNKLLGKIQIVNKDEAINRTRKWLKKIQKYRTKTPKNKKNE